LVCDEILRAAQALGFIKKWCQPRPDARAVRSAVRGVSTLETVTETLRLAGRAPAAADGVGRDLPARFVPASAHRWANSRLRADERAAARRQAGQDGVRRLLPSRAFRPLHKRIVAR
jgi:hypothetical protein